MVHQVLRLTIAILLVAPVLGGVPDARAQSTTQQVSLTRGSVKQFLASFPELQAIGKKYENQRSSGSSSDGNPIKALSAFMHHQGARAEFEQVLGKHGFKGFGDWIKVAQSIAITYGSVKSGKSVSELNAQAEAAISRIRNSDRFTEEQKAKMIDLLERQQGVVSRFQPLPENLTLVKTMIGEIEAVMDSR